MQKNRVFAFDRINYILLGVAVVIVLLGMVLMSGSGSTATHFESEIFSVRRIKLAPVVMLAGYLLMIYAIVRRPKSKETNETSKEA